MAKAYARIANPYELEEPINTCERIFNAMNAYPEMIAGTDGFCTNDEKHPRKVGRQVGLKRSTVWD